MEKYRKFIEKICNLDLDYARGDELDGAKGVAVVASYLFDGKEDITSIASNLELKPGEISRVMDRLTKNGIFSSRYDIKNDKTLKNHNSISSRNAWCIIAGIASGYTGLRENKNLYKKGSKNDNR